MMTFDPEQTGSEKSALLCYATQIDCGWNCKWDRAEEWFRIEPNLPIKAISEQRPAKVKVNSQCFFQTDLGPSHASKKFEILQVGEK